MPAKAVHQEHLELISNQLKIALSSGVVATWIVELETYTVVGDPALFEFFDLPYNEEGSLPLDYFINSMHPEDKERVLAAINKAILERTPYHIEYRVVGKSNKLRYVLASGKVDHPVNPTKFLGFIVDITEKKQLEEEKTRYELELKEKALAINSLLKQYEFVTNFMPQHVWTATPDGMIDFVNQQAVKYFGVPAEELKGPYWPAFVHPEDLERTTASWEHSLTTHDFYEVEFRLRAKDGSYQWFLARSVPFFQDNQVIKWFGTNTNIEEQRRSLEKKDEFLSIASHELKTPLTTVKAFFQLLQKTLPPTEMAFGLADKAGKQLYRLEQLINDLLDVSKVNAGKMAYNIGLFSFNDALKESVENVLNINASHQVIIEKTTDVTITGDKYRIEQVLNNLLSNAIKYSPGADKVVVKAESYGNNLIVSVQDFGIGIAPENLPNIFERYYRVDDTNMRFQGLGLGLYISSEIVKRHHGNIWIDSIPGQGSTFSFMLPINGQLNLEAETDQKTYYHSNFLDIGYDEQERILYATWLGYQNYDSVKKGGLAMLEMVRRNNCARVLNDNTNVTGNWSDGVAWGREVWFPEMQKAGLKYFAWIYPQSIFNMLSAQKSVNVMLDQVTVQFFTDRTEAQQWLKRI